MYESKVTNISKYKHDIGEYEMITNNFIFQNTTKIYFGNEQLVYLPQEVKKYGNRVLLTYGGGSIKRTGLYDKILKVLIEAGLTVFEFGGIEPNPRHTTVNQGVKICIEKDIDVLLAVGGGSTIDCTKIIAAARYYKGDSWDLIIHKAEIKKAMPLLTVLTLAATGSEMDNAAVISNVETKQKIGLLHPLLQPTASFLDPENTYTVNSFQTAAGSADIMAHIFDVCYFNRYPKMDMLDKVMEAVLKTVVKYAPIAVKIPDDYEARSNLMWASSWALNGFLQGGPRQMTTCHAMEHELSAFYDITHGLGLAIIIPRWMEYILDNQTAKDIKKFGVNVFGLSADTTDMNGAKSAIQRLKKFFYEELGLQSRLSDLGIDCRNFSIMAEKACRGDKIMGYRDLTPKDVEKIFEMCL